MTATQEDMIAELQRANVELQQRLDAALAQRNSEFDERIEQQAATIDVLRAMSASPGDTQPVFDLIVRQAQVQCDSASAALYEFDGMIHCRSFASGVLSSDAIEAYFRQFPMPLGQASNHALTVSIREQRIVHVRDAGAAEEVSTISRGQGVQSAIVVPLMTPSGAVGCIALSELRSGGYSRAQVALLQTFAEQAVIAIASAETYRALQTRTADLQESLEYQTATSDVLKTISRAAYDLDTVLTMLLVTAERLCGANHGQIWRKDGDAFRYAASHMNVPAYREKEEQTEIRTGRGTLVGRVGLESRPVLIADAWNDPEYEDKEGARLAQARSMLGVPLLRDGQLIGAFALARRAPIPFTDRQVDLVRAFADQAVIAMENARLLGRIARTHRGSGATQWRVRRTDRTAVRNDRCAEGDVEHAG